MKKEILKHWGMMEKNINLRSQRERILLFVTGIVVIWVLMFDFLISPASQEYTQVTEDYENLAQEYEGTHHELNVLNDKLNKQSWIHDNSEYKQKEAELNKNKAVLEKLHNQLMTPQKIPYLLESMLKDFQGLELLNVETLPLQEVSSNPSETQDTILYRQGIKLTFIGEYDAFVNYLKKIEKLPYPIWWEEVEYTVQTYPKAKITLVIYAISDHANWLKAKRQKP